MVCSAKRKEAANQAPVEMLGGHRGRLRHILSEAKPSNQHRQLNQPFLRLVSSGRLRVARTHTLVLGGNRTAGMVRNKMIRSNRKLQRLI